MAKRKTRTKKTAAKPGKVRMEARLDQDVLDRLKELAADADISLNQLVNGILYWAVNHSHAGEPVMGDDAYDAGSVTGTDEQPGCVWFGETAHEAEDERGEPRHDPGRVVFRLDYTQRRVVRDD